MVKILLKTIPNEEKIVKQRKNNGGEKKLSRREKMTVNKQLVFDRRMSEDSFSASNKVLKCRNIDKNHVK